MAESSQAYGEGKHPIPAIDEPTVIFMINRSLTGPWTDQNIYDATRCCWKIGASARGRAVYALGVSHGVIRGAYRIDRWSEAAGGRWRFDGRPAPELNVVDTSIARIKGRPGNASAVRLFLDGIPAASQQPGAGNDPVAPGTMERSPEVNDMLPSPRPDPTLSPRFSDALFFACQLHRDQARKGTQIPYVSHLLAVTAIVLEHGGSEDEAIAALLHDAVEDQGGATTRKAIRIRYGENVADIVEGCTDADVTPKPPWCERKKAYIAHIPGASRSVRLVSAADKLHNARAILADYRQLREELWGRFNGRREGTLWYYRALADAFHTAEATALTEELNRTVADLECMAAGHSGDAPAATHCHD